MVTMDTSPSRQRRVAAAIIDAAAGVLARSDGDANMEDVAAAAGVSRATLYRHFQNRDELLAALVVTAVDDLEGRLATADLEAVSVDEAVARIVRAFLYSGTRYAALLSTGTVAMRDPRAIDRRLGEPVRVVLRRGVATGVLRSDIPSEILFRLFTGLLAQSLKLVIADETGIEQAQKAVLDVFLDGAHLR